MALMGDNPRARSIVISLSIIGLLAIAFAWWYYRTRESTDDAQVDGDITPIASRVGGTVLAVNVRDNQLVDAGTVLVKIDTRDYEVAVARAQADLADAEAASEAASTGVPITTTTTTSQVTTARAAVERAHAGVDIATGDVESAKARRTSAQARLREAQVNQARASKDLERMKQLLAKDEVSQQQFDLAAATAESAIASVDAATAALADADQAVRAADGRRLQSQQQAQQAEAELKSAETAPAQVSVTKARAASAAARVEQAKALLAQAQLNLQYTSITAPVRGYVSKKSVERGRVIQAGQPLMALVPLDEIWITANFKETQLHDVQPGQRASVHVDMYNRDYSGKVESLAPATGARFSLLPPENATGNYVKVVQRVPVRIVLDTPPDAEHPLRPGLSVSATIFVR